MGEGFVVLSSNMIDFYYYMDEPGIVPEVPLMIELANGDVVECHAPVWGLDIRCGKGATSTNLTYLTNLIYPHFFWIYKEPILVTVRGPIENGNSFSNFFTPLIISLWRFDIALNCNRIRKFILLMNRLRHRHGRAKKGLYSHLTFVLAHLPKLPWTFSLQNAK